jgi:phosphohistidine swiveling domain-containing protein
MAMTFDKALASKMKRVRSAFGRRAGAADRAAAHEILARTPLGDLDPSTVSFHSLVHLIVKETRRRPAVPGNPIRKSVQILVPDSRNERVLVQHRGVCKRNFPDTITVTATAKPSADASPREVRQVLRKALKDETGLDCDGSRFQHQPRYDARHGRLTSGVFWACDLEEAQRLRDTFQRETGGQRASGTDGVLLDYSEPLQALFVYTVDLLVPTERVWSKLDAIEKATGVPAIFWTDTRTEHALFTVRLTEAEERAITERIELSSRASAPGSFEAWTRDRMLFVSWPAVESAFRHFPAGFALDVLVPHLRDADDWAGFTADLIDVDHPSASRVSVAGGKGHNLHVLRQAVRENSLPDVSVPPTAVITAPAFERIVLADETVRRLVAALDTSDEAERLATAAGIRARIHGIPFPLDLRAELDHVFQALGGDLAVRSSATIEDLEQHAGAGKATTVLHVITPDQMYTAVRTVWSSMYSDAFVKEWPLLRELDKHPRMAVLLQPLIDASAAGVVFSFDDAGARPVFMIGAQPGMGEGVVSAQGHVDHFWVGRLADVILERAIARKTSRIVTAPGGGTRQESISISAPSLTDRQVLEVAHAAATIQRIYRERDYAREIDVEFVVDGAQRLHIVQARPKVMQTDIAASGRTVMRLTTVDVARVPHGTPRVCLSSALVANPGAVVGRLQVIDGGEQLAHRAQSGSIVVTHHTNNSWNDVFAKLLGIITTDGGMTSHAAQNCQALNISCIVGATNALDELRAFDGQTVTFDADHRTVYLGHMPILTIDRPVDVWVDDADGVAQFIGTREAHELFRPWFTSRNKRPEVFLENFEGRWRRRSGLYGTFQLDYYYKAWNRLTGYFNETFCNRRPWRLQPLHREFRVDRAGGRRRRGLVQEVPVNDPTGVFAFVKAIEDFSLADAQRLFDDRWRGFQRFDAFMGGIDAISPDNVEHVVDQVIDVFRWMHIGFWIDAIVEEHLAIQQLKYVNPAIHNLLRNEAVGFDDFQERISSRSDVPAGRVLNLSRAKDRAIYACLEIIRSTPRLRHAFAHEDSETLMRMLPTIAPELFMAIEQWSMRFKRTDEDLRNPSDTKAYLEDISERLLCGSTISEDLLVAACVEYLDTRRLDRIASPDLTVHDPNLRVLLRGYARALSGQQRSDDWNALPMRERGEALGAVTAEEIDEVMPAALNELHSRVDQHRALRRQTQFMLERYPCLRKTLALSKMQFMLREDGHHLIVPHQRKLARMMRDAAADREHILGDRDHVFDISTDELIALVSEDQPTYIRETIGRWSDLEAAEIDLADSWSDDAEAAFGRFSHAIDRACSVLKRQAALTRTSRTRDGYLEEEMRLRRRVERLRALVNESRTPRAS